EFYVNNTLIGSVPGTSYPSPTIYTAYNLSFNTAAFADGDYTMTALAYDQTGNVGRTPSTVFHIHNTNPDGTLPTVSITSPVFPGAIPFATLSGIVNISIA